MEQSSGLNYFDSQNVARKYADLFDAMLAECGQGSEGVPRLQLVSLTIGFAAQQAMACSVAYGIEPRLFHENFIGVFNTLRKEIEKKGVP